MASQKDKNIIVITGANAGIGFEVANHLLADSNNHVIVGSRSVEKGQAALKDLQSRGHPGTAETVQLDVADPDSVAAAAKVVGERHGRINIIVNNAAVASFNEGTPLHEQLRAAFATNSTGANTVVDFFGPLLLRSTPHSPTRIVNVSSGVGSIERRLDASSSNYKLQAIPYRASKTALNMITACQAYEYGEKGVKVFAVCPGFTVSALSSFNNKESGAKPTSEGAKIIVRVIEGERDGEHAGFLHGEGQYPW